MSNLLLLPLRHTPEDQQIWREAVQRGWATARVGTNLDEIREKISLHSLTRYYGNVLHASQLEPVFPFKLSSIDPSFLVEAMIEGFTYRAICLMKASEVNQPFAIPTFAKSTGIKWIESRVYQVGESLGSGANPNDLVYLQVPVKFVDEVRCFVMDGKVLTGSYYRIDQKFNPQWWGEEGVTAIHKMVGEIYEKIKLPHGVVLDFGRLDTGEWALIEANEAWASGLYDCDPSKVFEVVVASQSRKRC